MDCSSGTCAYWGNRAVSNADLYGRSTYPSDIMYAGQETLGDYYNRANLLKSQWQEEKLIYENMLNEFTGPESTWIRLMLKSKLDEVKQRSFIDILRGTYSDRDIKPITPPAPDWMQDFIVERTVEPEPLPE